MYPHPPDCTLAIGKKPRVNINVTFKVFISGYYVSTF